MARLKYTINNLESPIFILHQEPAFFTMECLLFAMEGLQFRKTCVRNQHTNQSKQLIEHRIEWKAIIITLIEMSGRKSLIRFNINKEKLRIN